jgi:hypothetical protein
MPQNPIPVQAFRLGGNTPVYNVTAATVVKATPGTLYRIIVQTPPSAGNLTINDNAATGGTNTISNQIVSIAFGSLVAGQVIEVQWPCNTGITVSSVGTGGVFAVAYS